MVTRLNLDCIKFNSPDSVYWIMQKCWNRFPEKRPTFDDLHNQIVALLTGMKPDLEVTEEAATEVHGAAHSTTYGQNNIY